MGLGAAAGHPAAILLLVVLVALTATALMLGAMVTGAARPHEAPAPAWSGNEAPPGAVGLAPERRSLGGNLPATPLPVAGTATSSAP